MKVNSCTFLSVVLFLFNSTFYMRSYEDQYYSIKQTLSTIEVPYYKNIPNEFAMILSPCSKLNPEAVTYLRYYLMNAPMSDYEFPGAIFLMGFIGQKEDVDLLDKIVLQRIVEKHEKINKFTWYSLGAAFGSMISRNIHGAEATAARYLSLDFWMPYIERKTVDEAKIYSNLHAFSERLYQYSMSSSMIPYLTLRQQFGSVNRELLTDDRIAQMRGLGQGSYAHAIAMEIPDTNIITYGRGKVPESEFIDTMDRKYRNRMDFYDRLLRLQIETGGELNTEYSHPISSDTGELIGVEAVAFTESLMNSAINAADLLLQAQFEYAVILQSTHTDEFDNLMNRLLDNGSPLSAKSSKLMQIKNELAKDFDREKDIIGELKLLNVQEYLNPTVDIKFEMFASKMRSLTTVELAAISAVSPANSGKQIVITDDEKAVAKLTREQPVLISPDAEVKFRTIVIVTFELPGTERIAKKYVPKSSPKDTTIAPSGNLKVYMKKINDIWYWNPFGW